MVRHFAEMAEEASRLSQAAEDLLDLYLQEIWVGGDLVTPGSEIDHVVAILMMDVPADELPEIALHESERALAYWLRLDKRPMITRSRPASRPAWSHLERRVARVWSLADGPDTTNLDGLRTPLLAHVTVVEPTDDELLAWLDVENPRSERHLDDVLDRYWEGSWRRDHTGGGIHPDDHLWRAAWAVRSMQEARRSLDSP